MRDMKNLKKVLAGTCLAAVTMAILPALPAQAGMGTGNPPPPPPPPKDIAYRMYEGSSDSNLGGKGFPGITVLHVQSAFDGSTSCTTTANGNFKYTIREGQAISHRSRMFGISSAWVASDIIIATDAVLTLKAAGGEADFDNLAKPGGGVTRWKADYDYIRGVTNNYSSDLSLDFGARSFAQRFVPRNTTATPLQEPPKKATFQLNKLEGYSSDGTLLIKWMDDKDKGRIDLAPGQNASLSLKKLLAVTQK